MEIPEQEYEQLKRNAEGNPKLCHGVNCDYMKEHLHKKWSFSHFKVSMSKIITLPEVWIFLIVTVIFIIFAPKTVLGVWIGFFIVSGCFMFFKPLSSLISRGNLNVSASVGASLNKSINKQG